MTQILLHSVMYGQGQNYFRLVHRKISQQKADIFTPLKTFHFLIPQIQSPHTDILVHHNMSIKKIFIQMPPPLTSSCVSQSQVPIITLDSFT